MTGWRWTVLSDGWTEVPQAAALPDRPFWSKMRFCATAVLLEHPSHGRVLFDTCYSSRFFTETESWPYRIYRLLTPVTLSEPMGVAEELRQQGIEGIDHIIISHWHADHIGGLLDFPEVPIHSHPEAWKSIQGLRGFAALQRAFLPGLVPKDAGARMRWLSEGSDLFGDGSMTAIELSGHAIGQIGIRFVSASGQPILLATDACWVSTAYRENQMPHPLTRIIHDWSAYRKTLERLHHLHRSEPELLILPCHCPETAALIQTYRRNA